MAKQDTQYNQILSDLRKASYHNLYLLMGEEPYYIDQITDFMQNKILDESQKEFDLTVLYGDMTDMKSIVNTAKRYPMISTHQVVIIKEAQLIKDWEPLQYYINQPLASTILVFAYKYGTIDKRKKWVQDITKKGVVFESVKLRDYEIGSWINNYIRTKNLSIDEKAVIMLSEFLGTDLSKLTNEIDKLIITKSPEATRITPELVEKNIGISKDFNVFELQSALINCDILKANRIIRYFADNKKANPIQMVLPQLFNFFSNLMLYHYLPDKSQQTVASELKINPYFTKDYEKAARTFNAWKTMNIITFIRETDAKSKGIECNNIDDGELMKELIYKILH